MQRYLVTFSVIIALLILLLTKQSNLAILSSSFLGLAISTLYGERKLNFLFIVLFLPFTIFANLSNYDFYAITLASVVSYYFVEISYLYIALGVSIVSIVLPDLASLYLFLGLVVSYRMLKYDARGIIGSGIVILITSAFVSGNLRVTLGNVAYFDLVFGVIATLIENTSWKIPQRVRIPIVLSLFPLMMFLYPLPSEYYWWNPNSFLFKNFLSLYVMGYGVNPRIDEAAEYLLASFFIGKFGQIVGLHLFFFVIYLVSGLTSYLFFQREKTLLSFVYSVLTPIQYPSLAMTYALFPLALYLTTKLDLKRTLAFSLISLSSTLVFPFLYLISSFLLDRRKEYAILSFGLSLFWLVPYAFIGFPSLEFSVPLLEVYILITIVGILAFLYKGNNYLTISLLVSLFYLALNLPYSIILYPLLALGLLYLVSDKRYAIPAMIITLLVFQGFTLSSSLSFSSIPTQVSNAISTLEKYPLGYVNWQGNYSLLSPYPLMNQTLFASYTVTPKYNVTTSVQTNLSPYPIEIVSNSSSSMIVSPISSSTAKFYNGTIFWYINSSRVTSSIEIYFYPSFNLSNYIYLKSNITDLKNLTIYVFTQTRFFKFTNTSVFYLKNQSVNFIQIFYYAWKPIIFEITPMYNNSGNIIPIAEIYSPYTFSISFKGGNEEVVMLHSKVYVTISVIEGFSYSMNESKFTNSSTVLPPGYYEIIVLPKLNTYESLGITGSILSFIVFVVYLVTKDKLKRIVKLRRNVSHKQNT